MNTDEDYAVFIGLEIHIHLKTESKMFCACRARYGDEPNTNICPVCLAYPGTLPQANEKALEMAYLAAETLKCRTAERVFFARKNYFYPDMPKNYQISQYGEPVGLKGTMEAELRDGKPSVLGIRDVHLEEDAGKMIHAGDVSLLDFNRAGFPLLEVVTEPELHSGEEAETFLREFQRLVRHLGISDGNMEEGSMKCDANISLNRPGMGLGAKVEIKNMNSPRFVRLAMNHEVSRQSEILSGNQKVVQETRLWNENRDLTESMRRKEEADDYRYFPEPDLPPFTPDRAFHERVKSAMIELPLEKKRRMMREYELSAEQAEFLHDNTATARFFEETVSAGASPRDTVVWLWADVQKHINREETTLAESSLSSQRLAELLKLIDEGTISGKIAKRVLGRIFAEDADPAAIVEREQWSQISDTALLTDIVDAVLRQNERIADAVRSGDAKQRDRLMGEVMKASNGRAAPRIAGRILDERLAAAMGESLPSGPESGEDN